MSPAMPVGKFFQDQQALFIPFLQTVQAYTPEMGSVLFGIVQQTQFGFRESLPWLLPAISLSDRPVCSTQASSESEKWQCIN